MTKLAKIGDNILFAINTVNAQNGELLYYVANNQPNSAFTTGNTGSFSLASNVGNVSLIIAGGAVSDTDFTLQIRRNSILGTILAESSNVFIVFNSTHGWFGGGQPGVNLPSFSRVDRITFASDTATASVRGPLSLARRHLAATGNKDFGWFGGGSPGPVSRVDRITFASDTATASARGPLSLGRSFLAATGNNDFGWFGGGFGGPGPGITTVDRIDFADDTATTSVRGPLSLVIVSLAATGNKDYGWFGGGASGPDVVSRVDRIDFAADTATASARGPLSEIRHRLAATGNNDFGWFGGGAPWSTGNHSRVDRINFAADTATASARGPLSLARSNPAATGNLDYGWFGGGVNAGQPGEFSTVDRIDFADDTATASVRGPLSVIGFGEARGSLAATAGDI